MPCLRPGWSARIDTGTLIVSSDTRTFKISGVLAGDRLLNALAGRASWRDVGLPLAAREALLEALQERGVVGPRHHKTAGLHARQAAYVAHYGMRPSVVARRIADARILVLGLGGTGTVVLQHLVGARIRNFVLVDGDRVAVSNLDRQFIYRRKDVGQRKPAVARNYILDREPKARIAIVNQMITSADMLQEVVAAHPGITLAVVAIDHPAGRVFDLAVETLYHLRIPCIFGGAMINAGICSPMFAPEWPASNPRRHGYFRDSQGRAQPTRVVFSPVNTAVGTLMAAECLHFVYGLTDAVNFEASWVIDLRKHMLQPWKPR